MRRRFPVIVPVLVAVGLLAALFLGGSMFGRNNQRLGQNGTTQQGRNLIGNNLQGANPNTSPNNLRMPGGNQNPGTGNNPPSPIGIGTTPGPGNNTGLNRIGQQMQQPIGFDGQKADNIRNKLGNIDGVKQINTIVHGNTALIGYSPSNATKDVNTTKKMITDRVKQIDNTITNVVVSDSADISSRIGQLGDKIKNSKPANDLKNDFNKLIQSIKPAGSNVQT